VSTSVSDIRSGFATRIALLSGWKESPFLFDSFGRDPNSIAHLAFSVGVGRTEVTGSRQARTVGAYCRTTVTVRFTARVKPKDAPASVDEALDAEQQLVNQVMEQTWPGTYDVLLVSAERTATDTGEFLRHEVTFSAIHQLALQ